MRGIIGRNKVDAQNTNYVTENGILYNKSKTVLMAYPAAKKGDSFNIPSTVKEVGDYAFTKQQYLKNVSIGNNVYKLGDGAFDDSGITKFPDWLSTNSEGDLCISSKVTYSGTYLYKKAFEVLKIVNKERKKAGLSELKMDKELLNAAMMRSAETALDFSHTRPDGGDCFSICDKMSGENIAVGQSTPESVMNSWMNSSGHRANIRGSSYKSIGIGCFTQGGMLYWGKCFGGQSAISVKQPADKAVTLKVAPYTKITYKGKVTGINLTNPKASVKAKKGKNTVTWKKSSKATGYYVYRKVGNGKWKNIKTIKKHSTVKYIDKKVKKGKKYQYKIVAYKGSTKVASKTKQIKAK